MMAAEGRLYGSLPRLNDMNTDIDNDISTACDVMRRGGVILYPTDTVWGIGCDARNPQAVARVFAIKGRADGKSMIVLVNSIEMLQGIVEEIPDKALEIIANTNIPTTVIYPNAKGLAKGLVAQDKSVGARITNEAFSSSLCGQFGGPIVSTSANISGEPTPKVFADISDEIIKAVDFVVSYRRDDFTEASASRIVKLNPDNTLTTIRE